MIRAFAVGMSGATIGVAMLPIVLITGAPITGLVSDVVFVVWWLAAFGFGEAVTRAASPGDQQPTAEQAGDGNRAPHMTLHTACGRIARV